MHSGFRESDALLRRLLGQTFSLSSLLISPLTATWVWGGGDDGRGGVGVRRGSDKLNGMKLK